MNKQKFLGQGYSSDPMYEYERVTNPRTQEKSKEYSQNICRVWYETYG